MFYSLSNKLLTEIWLNQLIDLEVCMKKILIAILTIISTASYASECNSQEAISSVKAFLTENYEITNDVKAVALDNTNNSRYTVVFTYQEEIVGFTSVAKFPMAGYLTVEKSNCKVNENEVFDSGLLK